MNKISDQILRVYAVFINGIGLVSTKIDPRLREIVMNISIFLLSCLGIIKYLNDDIKDMIDYSKDKVNIPGVILLLILLAVCIDRRVDYKRLKGRSIFIIAWVTSFGLMFALTYVHPVVRGYYLWTVISLVFAIPFAMIWRERGDFEYFCGILAKNVLIAVSLFYIINLIVTPMMPNSVIWGDYYGIVANRNNNGFVCTAAYVAAMYLLLHGGKHRFLYELIMGFSIAMPVASVCRTGELTILAVTVVGLVYYLALTKHTAGDRPIKKLLTSAVVVIAIAIVSNYLLVNINILTANAYAADQSVVIEREISGDEIYNKLNEASSNRLEVWKAYISHSTFWGNGNKTKGPQIEGYEPSKYAHNNAIEVLYVSGVIAFIGYLIWIFTGVAFVIGCLRGKYGYHKLYLMVIMAFTGYFIQAMLEILIYPMCNIPTMMMYVCLMPIVLDMREEDAVE